ncbi:hypothetical protein NC653_032382 [Populus alba x Populus x berolinensis]|uniref:Uncharacterized protein n=1 Tax=Populus alba x Populus x berolinensis TaxID=444605 RepID=A0AAD6LRK3_9ROSI|nr:hypothetical protein NC653_032382 [Populus alba x Populus x berolinensis]
MASGSHSQGVEEGVSDKSIKEKVWSLKSAFMSQHFAEIEGLLLAMKEEMEIEKKSLKKEKESMEEKARSERSERLKAEIELKECKRECLQLKKEKGGFNELLSISGEDKRIIRELREEICELKCAKLKVETEVDAYKSKFQELEMRVFLLEKDLMSLIPEEPVNNVRVSRGVVEEKVVLNENVVTVKTEVVCCDSNDTIAVEANGDPRSHSPESRNGDVGGPGSVSGEGSGLGERAMMENGNGSDRVGNVKAETIDVDNHENMVLGASGGSGSNLPENGDGNIGASGGCTRQSQDIIEINDSDDDSSSSATLSGKKLTKQGYQHEADLGLEDVNNETKLLKRKRTSPSNSKDDSGGIKEPGAKKCQVLIQGPESVPVNYCAATTMFSGSDDRRNIFNQSRQAPTILRQYEEEIRVGQNSQIQQRELVLDGSDGEQSSSSSDSDDFNFPTDSTAIKPTQANRIHKKWKSEADMVATLEKDEELRLRAVCALFGQQAAVQKSSNFTSTFQNQGFDKVDATRGTALFEFLTNGDPQGKLKKSTMELLADDPGGFRDCKRLTIKYSKQLFEMWQVKGDPLFFK